MGLTTLKETEDFWLLSTDNRVRQYRKHRLNRLDDELSDREVTISLLCEELKSAREEIEELSHMTNQIRG